MTPHAQLVQSARHARKTLYLVAGFYVAIGFVMALVSAIQGDRLGAFLGFLIISGALVMGLLFRAALHLGVRISAMGDSLDDLRRRLDHLDDSIRGIRLPPSEKKTQAAEFDLSTMGIGDPSVLAAATLDRDVYPRLVATMEEEPPAQAISDVRRVQQSARPDASARSAADAAGVDEFAGAAGPAIKSLLRNWRIALREGDLVGCRVVLSALIDTAGEEAVVPLREQIAALADRVEQRLRSEFSAHVRSRNFESAIGVGDQITTLLADRPVAAEYTKLKPLLERQSKRNGRHPTSALPGH